MEAAIRDALRLIEAQHNVRILYAVEAGSRAWGIESQESDYDVRFIYVHPRDRYLRLDVPRDVIERPIVDLLDISGWDAFKALRLLRKSNPALLEWLFSPVIYLEASPVIAEMRRIARSLIAPHASIHCHYEHMARGNYRQYIKNRSLVPLKKYLYVVRPLVMLCYLDQYGVFPVSMKLSSVLATVSLSTASITEAEERRQHIDDLIARKRAGEELGMGAPDHVLNAFIEEQLARCIIEDISGHNRAARRARGKAIKRNAENHDRAAMQRETEQVLQAVLSEEAT